MNEPILHLNESDHETTMIKKFLKELMVTIYINQKWWLLSISTRCIFFFVTYMMVTIYINKVYLSLC